MNVSAAGGIVVAGLVLAACGCQTDRPEPTPEEVPAAFLTAACQRAAACATQPDLETCMAIASLPSGLATGLASLRAGRAVYHADQMRECLARLAVASCSTGEFLEIGDICSSSFEGIVPPWAPCVTSADCRTGECEGIGCTESCCMGTCGPPPLHQTPPGGACATDGDCVVGSICALAGTCVTPVGEGESCAATTVCGAYLSCTAGVCTRPAGRGASCDLRLGFFACDRTDDYCDPAALTCVPRRTDGESCQADDTTGIVGTCVRADWCDAGTCRPLPVVGEACANSVFCLSSLLCNPSTGLCQRPPPPALCGG
jgi:hypothetical protein